MVVEKYTEAQTPVNPKNAKRLAVLFLSTFIPLTSVPAQNTTNWYDSDSGYFGAQVTLPSQNEADRKSAQLATGNEDWFKDGDVDAFFPLAKSIVRPAKHVGVLPVPADPERRQRSPQRAVAVSHENLTVPPQFDVDGEWVEKDPVAVERRRQAVLQKPEWHPNTSPATFKDPFADDVFADGEEVIIYQDQLNNTAITQRESQQELPRQLSEVKPLVGPGSTVMQAAQANVARHGVPISGEDLAAMGLPVEARSVDSALLAGNQPQDLKFAQDYIQNLEPVQANSPQFADSGVLMPATRMSQAEQSALQEPVTLEQLQVAEGQAAQELFHQYIDEQESLMPRPTPRPTENHPAASPTHLAGGAPVQHIPAAAKNSGSKSEFKSEAFTMADARVPLADDVRYPNWESSPIHMHTADKATIMAERRAKLKQLRDSQPNDFIDVVGAQTMDAPYPTTQLAANCGQCPTVASNAEEYTYVMAPYDQSPDAISHAEALTGELVDPFTLLDQPVAVAGTDAIESTYIDTAENVEGYLVADDGPLQVAENSALDYDGLPMPKPVQRVNMYEGQDIDPKKAFNPDQYYAQILDEEKSLGTITQADLDALDEQIEAETRAEILAEAREDDLEQLKQELLAALRQELAQFKPQIAPAAPETETVAGESEALPTEEKVQTVAESTVDDATNAEDEKTVTTDKGWTKSIEAPSPVTQRASYEDPSTLMRYFNVPQRPSQVNHQARYAANPYQAPTAFDLSRSQAVPAWRQNPNVATIPSRQGNAYYARGGYQSPAQSSSGHQGYNPYTSRPVQWPQARTPQEPAWMQRWKQQQGIKPQAQVQQSVVTTQPIALATIQDANPFMANGAAAAFSMAETVQLPGRNAVRYNGATESDVDSAVTYASEKTITLNNSLRMVPINNPVDGPQDYFDAAALQKAAAVVYFGNGSSGLTANAHRVLRQVAASYKEQPRTVVIEGHASKRTRNTSQQEQNIANFRVALERAEIVMKTLRQYGVDVSAIQVRARGAENPAYEESIPRGEAYNRRVEIYFQ